MNKYTLGTIIGAATLGLAKAKSGGRSINLPINRYYNGIPEYKPEYLEDLYNLTPEEKLSIKYLNLSESKTKTQPSKPKNIFDFSGKYSKHDYRIMFRLVDESLIATEQQKREYDEYYKNHVTTFYDFFAQFDDIFIGFDNIEKMSMSNFGNLSEDNFYYLKKYQDPNWNRLPSSLYNLKKLDILNIEKNNLHVLPDGLSELSNLESLWVLNNNPVKYIPKSFGKLKKLKNLWRSTSFSWRDVPFTKPVPIQVLINLINNGNEFGGDIKDLVKLNPDKKSNLRVR